MNITIKPAKWRVFCFSKIVNCNPLFLYLYFLKIDGQLPPKINYAFYFFRIAKIAPLFKIKIIGLLIDYLHYEKHPI